MPFERRAADAICAPKICQRQCRLHFFRRDRPCSPAVLAPVAAGLR